MERLMRCSACEAGVALRSLKENFAAGVTRLAMRYGTVRAENWDLIRALLMLVWKCMIVRSRLQAKSVILRTFNGLWSHHPVTGALAQLIEATNQAEANQTPTKRAANAR
jgi:hypothetical protein